MNTGTAARHSVQRQRAEGEEWCPVSACNSMVYACILVTAGLRRVRRQPLFPAGISNCRRTGCPAMSPPVYQQSAPQGQSNDILFPNIFPDLSFTCPAPPPSPASQSGYAPLGGQPMRRLTTSNSRVSPATPLPAHRAPRKAKTQKCTKNLIPLSDTSPRNSGHGRRRTQLPIDRTPRKE
jgi:hypothetical protein